MNIYLLGAWVKRYMRSEGKICKNIIDNKYKPLPNIFCIQDKEASTLWKGVMWASKAIKFGYIWSVGDGTKIRFWEDCWFGNSPLSIQFWDLYCICREQGQTIRQIWDGENLKLTFRRTFSPALMNTWYELEAIVGSIVYTEDSDSLVWQYTATGTYTTSSLYAIINYRGVSPVFIPSVWKLIVPPRIHIFL